MSIDHEHERQRDRVRWREAGGSAAGAFARARPPRRTRRRFGNASADVVRARGGCADRGTDRLRTLGTQRTAPFGESASAAPGLVWRCVCSGRCAGMLR